LIIFSLYIPIPEKAFRPAYLIFDPIISSILNNWLYFAVLSDLDIEPVLICIAFFATAISAIIVSSVSPERCEITIL